MIGIAFLKVKAMYLNRGNYRGLKLLDHGMKILERFVLKCIEQQIRHKNTLNDMFHARLTIDAIFIVRQMQEKYNASFFLFCRPGKGI